MADIPQFIGSLNIGLTKFVQADGTNAKTIFTPGATDSRLMALSACSTANASIQFHLSLVRGGVRYRLDTVTLPAATAITPTTNWNLLDATWFEWIAFLDNTLPLTADITLEAAPAATISAGAEVAFFAWGGNF